MPEEEAFPEALLSSNKSKAKKAAERTKRATATNSSPPEARDKGDLSMPQTDKSKNKVQYQEVGSQLHYHASTGNWEVVQELLDGAPDAIECRSQDGRTILHVTASLGHKKIVVGLLDRGVDINARMENGITPLMLCTAQGQNEVVALLLEHHPDLFAQTTKDGYTALHLAVMHQQLAGAQKLLDYAATREAPLPPVTVHENTSESKASKKERKKDVAAGKESKRKASGRFIDVPSNKGYTALHLAIVENEMQMTRVLLDRQADFYALTLRRWTSLHFAAHVGNEEACQLLLQRDPNMVLLKNDAGERPADIAALRDHPALVEVLDATPLLKSSSSRSLLRKKKSPFGKKKAKEGKKELIIVDQTQQQSLLDMFQLPEFEGKEGESVVDALSQNPELLSKMKEDPVVFLKYLPRDMQELLVRDVEKNPELLQEVVEMGKEVMLQVIEEHPEQLLSTMKNPFALFKQANTPGKLMKLIRQLEENPMIVLKDEFQKDPELFLIKELRDNPRLLYLVVDKVRQEKPQLLPLLRVVIGVNPDDAHEPEFKEKGLAGKMKSKVVRAAVNKYMKKMSDQQDPDLEQMDLGQAFQTNDQQNQQLDSFRNLLHADGATILKQNGISGPLFTTEEYYVRVDADGNEIPDEDKEEEKPAQDTPILHDQHGTYDLD